MIIKDIYDKFVVDKENYLYEQFRIELWSQLKLWIPVQINVEDNIIKEAVYCFVEHIEEYSITTDCYVALVGYMRIIVIEYLAEGKIPVENCCKALQEYYNERNEIPPIAQKQLNIVLSKFNRKMFDYFINRYYYLQDIPYNKKSEKKIKKCFHGKGSLYSLYAMNRFKPVTCTSSAYIQYLNLLHPIFVEQIGTGKKFMFVHSDVNEKYTLQRIGNRARYALPGVILVSILILILAWLKVI